MNIWEGQEGEDMCAVEMASVEGSEADTSLLITFNK